MNRSGTVSGRELVFPVTEPEGAEVEDVAHSAFHGTDGAVREPVAVHDGNKAGLRLLIRFEPENNRSLLFVQGGAERIGQNPAVVQMNRIPEESRNDGRSLRFLPRRNRFAVDDGMEPCVAGELEDRSGG